MMAYSDKCGQKVYAVEGGFDNSYIYTRLNNGTLAVTKCFPGQGIKVAERYLARHAKRNSWTEWKGNGLSNIAPDALQESGRETNHAT